MTITNLTIARGDTSASPGVVGAGILNLANLTASNCTFFHNDTRDGGGAIDNNTGATAVVSNCTFYSNSSIIQTGAIYNSGTLSVNNSTITSNNGAFSNSAGGVNNVGVAHVRNSVIAGNSGISKDVRGAFISDGYNFIGVGDFSSSGFGNAGSHDQVGSSGSPANPMLGPLMDNGGPTQTLRPLPGSLLIDQGDSGLTTDQRGFLRPADQPGTPNAGDGSDIGAVEVGAPQTGPTFTVMNTFERDEGACRVDSCTLLEALNATNANPDANTINFAAGVTGLIDTLTTPIGLYINNPVTINGPGARILAIRGGGGPPFGIGRMFFVDASNVTIAGLKLVSGFVSNDDGGAIYHNSGTLTLTDCTLAGNVADPATNGGGAILNQDGTTLNLVRCTFFQNSTNSLGGAIYNGGILTATNCTFFSNSALNGGGIISRFVNGLSKTTLRNCTITGCSASSTGTTAGDGGGGLYAEGGAQQYHLANTIIAGNTSASSPATNPDIRGQVTSDGHNFIGIIGNATGLTNGVNGDQVGNSATPKNPMFGSFANNGGPTDTIALTSASTAINAGDNNFAPVTDQRGYFRVGISDMGAYEFNGTPPPPVPVTSIVSRKVHGGAGPFEINLLSGSPAIECRSGGAIGNHTIVFKFANPVTSVGTAGITGTGRVSSSAIGTDPHEYLVSLTGITNAQVVSVSLTNVTDSASNRSDTITASMGILLGDTTGNGSVNATDVSQTKAKSGQAVSASNFRTDVTVSNSINSSDVSIIKSKSGTALP